MTAPTKLTLYNDALLLCGERFLASLTEEREPRRLLDRAWDGGAIRACLEMGQWGFAMRTVQLDYDTNIQPDFGYARAFVKPTDWVLTSGLCSDEFFRCPLNRYTDEAGYWYSDLETIYVRYVSDDVGYGGNYALWPDSFRDLVAEYLARRVIRKLTNSDAEESMCEKRLARKTLFALNRAQMAQPTSFSPPGNWSSSRSHGRTSRDGGNRGSLIG